VITGLPDPRNWTPPVELQAPPPRPVSRRGQIGVLLLALILTAAFCGYLAWAAAGEDQRLARLRSGSRTVLATVTTTSYGGKVRYEFPFRGQTIAGSANGSRRQIRALRRGAPLAVRFLPSDPQINHPEAWTPLRSTSWRAAAGMGVLSLLLLLCASRVRREAEVLANGVPTPGLVLETSPRDRTGYIELRYRFTAGAGEVLDGSGRTRFEVPAGATVCVVFLPADPRCNVVYIRQPVPAPPDGIA
jgi:hypothetical protein